jgi:hypothetical protein
MSDPPSETQWPASLHVRRIGTFYVIFYREKPVSVSFREEAAAKCTLDSWQAQMAAGIIRVVDGALTPPPIEWKLPSPQRLVEAVAAAAEAERVATRARLAALEEQLAEGDRGVAPLSQPPSYPPRFPRNLPDRIAVALLRDRPEGRWADVEKMIDDFTHDSRSGFKSVSERNFKEAKSRLARYGFKQWKWR